MNYSSIIDKKQLVHNSFPSLHQEGPTCPSKSNWYFLHETAANSSRHKQQLTQPLPCWVVTFILLPILHYFQTNYDATDLPGAMGNEETTDMYSKAGVEWAMLSDVDAPVAGKLSVYYIQLKEAG